MKKVAILLGLLPFNIGCNSNTKTTYKLTPSPIDVVIPCHEKDKRTLDLVIQGIAKNGVNIRRIIIISKQPLSELAEWISEDTFPFTKYDIGLAIAHGDKVLGKKLSQSWRMGWYYQQFLKLYAPFVIENISPNVLVLDADTIFLNPVEFMNEKGEPYFNVGREYCKPYFEHAAKLLDEPYTITKLFPNYSGICHHMLLQKPVLEDLFEKIEKKSGKTTWETLCYHIDLAKFKKSAMSEYEIYFNFIMSRTNQATIRKLKWKNAPYNKKTHNKKLGYHYISCHNKG